MKTINMLRFVCLTCSLLVVAGCKPTLSVEVSDGITEPSGEQHLAVFEGESATLHWQAKATQWAFLDKVTIEPGIGDVADSGSMEISDITASTEYTVTAHSKSPNSQTLNIHALTPYCEGSDHLSGEPYRVGLEVVRPDASDDSGPLPAVVMVHGGSFIQGDMVELWAFADEAVRRDYVAININYRLLPTEPDEPDYSWPGGLQDVKCAIRYVRAHADELNVDVNNIGIMGHSAGAYLATMVALTGSADNVEYDDVGQFQGVDDSVKALVSIAAPLDLMDTFQLLRSKVVLDPEYILIQATLLESLNMIFRQMGLNDDGSINDADRDDPDYVASTPYSYITDNLYGNLDRPMMFIYGEADYAIPASNGCDFITSLRTSAENHQIQHNAIMRHYLGPEASHISFIPPLKNDLVESLSNYGRKLDQTLQESFDFFDVHLKGLSQDRLPETSTCDSTGEQSPL